MPPPWLQEDLGKLPATPSQPFPGVCLRGEREQQIHQGGSPPGPPDLGDKVKSCLE